MHFRNFSLGQEVTREDLNAIPTSVLKGIYDKLVYEMGQRIDDSFFSDSFKVNFSNSTTIILKKGLGFQKTTATSPDIERLPVVSDVDQSITIQTPDAANNRIDLVCVKSNLENELTGMRKFKNSTSGAISNEEFVLQKKFTNSTIVVVGTPSGAPAVPATPAGYIAVSQILVTAVSGIASQNAITDLRSLMSFGPDIRIDTTLFTRLTQNENYKLKYLLLQIDSILEKGSTVYPIANSQAALADVGYTINVATKNRWRFRYSIRRKTDTNESNLEGDLYIIYNSVTNTMVAIENSFGDDCGVEFTPVLISESNWKLQYISSTISGSSYVGSLDLQLVKEY